MKKLYQKGGQGVRMHGASLVAQRLKSLPAMHRRPRFDSWVRKIP